MAVSSAPFTRPPQLDRFLHALVGTEPTGMETSVLSVLARLGHDPWAEAVRLASLPRAMAVDDLAGALASVPPGNRPHAEAKAVALRLVRLLPVPTRVASGATSVEVPQGSRRAVVVLAGTLLSAALVFGLLIGTAVWPAVHVGLPGIATDALASTDQPGGPSHRAGSAQLINGSNVAASSSRPKAEP
jgi:hypothetical protein